MVVLFIGNYIYWREDEKTRAICYNISGEFIQITSLSFLLIVFGYALHLKPKKIELISGQLKEVKKELLYKRDFKEGLLVKNRLTQKTLELEKKEVNNIAFSLRNDEKKYKRNILAKEKESQKIDKQIDKLTAPFSSIDRLP